MSRREWRIAVRSTLTAPGVSLVVLLVVAVLACAAAAAPALLTQARTAAVRDAVQRIDPVVRDLGAGLRGAAVPGPSDDGSDAGGWGDPAVDEVWGASAERLAAIRDGLPADIRRATDAAQLVVALDPQSSVPLDQSPRRYNRMRVLFDPGFSSRVTIVEGVTPVDASEADVVAAALSTTASDRLEWPVGETRILTYAAGELAVTVTGLFEPVDAEDDVWSHLPTALAPSISARGSGDLVLDSALLADPTRLGDAGSFVNEVATNAWYPLDTTGIESADAVDLTAELRGLAGEEQAFPIDDAGEYTGALLFDSSTPQALEEGLARADLMTAVLAAVAGGPVVVAAATLALTARMLSLRRIASVRLAQARGASTRLVAVVLGAEGLALGIVGASLGAVGAALTVGADRLGIAFAAVVAMLPAVILPTTTLAAAARTARDDLGAPPPARARLRLLADLVLVAAAAALAGLTVARGAQAGVDPILVLLPVAVVGVGGVAAIRLVPALVARVEAVGARRPGLMGLVGPARARRETAVRAAPVLAVVTGVAIALFAVTFAATVRSAADTSARRAVGADLRVSAPSIDAVQRDALAAIPGVRALALLVDQQRVEARAGDRRVPAVVYVVDAAAFADVQLDGEAAPDWALPLPARLADTSADDIPVVASEGFATDAGGAVAEVDDIPLDVLATTPTANPFGDARSWLLVDAANADRLLTTPSSPRVAFLALEADADPAAVAAGASAVLGDDGATVTPAQAAARLSEDPAAAALRGGLLAAVLVVAASLCLAVAVTLVLGSAPRRRLVALLTALGLPRRRELPLAVWEAGPALLVALAVGTAVGLVLPYVVIPALDLSGFVGSPAPPPIVLDPGAITAVVGGALAVIAIAVAGASLVASRARHGVGDAEEGR